MNKLKLSVLLGVFIALEILLAFSFYTKVDESYISESMALSPSEQQIIQNCKDKDVFDTTECLINEVKKFYKFKVTNDEIKLSFEQLKERGGDCRDWALFYEKIGEELSMSSYSFHIDNQAEYGHRFAVLMDSKGYCIIDQIYASCFNF
tara:strand:- start:4308 stop:4754 length:447 start_codon:yes stop_codon:yes gene_type:complete